MSETAVVVLSLAALVILGAFWEWRYRTYGWGRGTMHSTPTFGKHSRHGLGVDPAMVWDVDIPVTVIPTPYDWQARGDFESWEDWAARMGPPGDPE